MRVFVFFGVLLWAANGAAQTASPPDKARIRQLVGQLSDNTFQVREAAHRELSEFAEYAAVELGEATESKDLEQARRAKQILGFVGAADPTHRIVDALDRPIKTARIAIKQGGVTQVGFTDLLGRFAISYDDKRPVSEIVVTLRHPEYGIARWSTWFPRRPADKSLIDCKMPIVPLDAEARNRAVRGTVLDGLGKPVPDVVLHCAHVRTQGEGLLTAESETGDVITDGQGRFALYLVANKPTRETALRGGLVPPGSRYNLTVTAPYRDDCFPLDDMFSNDAPLEIRMPLATRLHRFRFAEARGLPDTGWRNSALLVEFFPKEGDPHRVRLVTDEVVKGRKMIPGKYVATHFLNGRTVQYLPLRIDENSPEELTFQLPKATVYRGRTVDGVTGKPMGRVWTAATKGRGRANLAELTDADWNQLRAVTDIAGPMDHATKILGVHYGIGALVRTDDEGRFEITEPPEDRFYGIMAFAENFLPIEERVIEAKRGGVFEIGDLPLFPAAKLNVKIVAGEKKMSVYPRWKVEKDKQPEWLERFGAADDRRRRMFQCEHWMPTNEVHSVFIPSDLRLRVEFDPQYESPWASGRTELLLAKQGEVIAGGEVSLPKSVPVEVRVVDHQGNPVEGVAVYSSHTGQRGWGIAYNTDAKGVAHFFSQPNSEGKICVEISRPPASSKMERIETTFQIRDQARGSPFEFRLTAEQVQLIPRAGTDKKKK